MFDNKLPYASTACSVKQNLLLTYKHYEKCDLIENSISLVHRNLSAVETFSVFYIK